MKLSVFTVATPELTPDELAAVAKEVGLDGIEWRYTEVPEAVKQDPPSYWGNNLSTISPSGGAAELERFKAASERHGIRTISVTPYIQAGDLATTEQVLQAAKTLGASMIRLGVPRYDGTVPYAQLFELERAYLKDAAELCKQYGIKGLIEMHHLTISASASASRRLVDGLNPDHVGVLFDPGNCVFEGFEDNRMAIDILGPYLGHVHVKNAGWTKLETSDITPVNGIEIAKWSCNWMSIEQGVVPWREIIGHLRNAGYNGYLGVEDFSKTFADSRTMLKFFVDYIGGLLKE